MNTKQKALGIGIAALSILAGNAFGQWIGPTYSPPGGVTWADLTPPGPNTGAAFTGGATWEVTGLDLGASTELYFGVHSTYYPALGINGLDPHFTYNDGASDFGNGKSVWTGSITIPLSTGGSTTRDARYTLTLTDLVDNPLGLINSTTVSTFPTLEQGILHVTDASGFKLNHLFEIADVSGTTYDPALEVYNDLSTVQGNQLWNSVGGAFYAIPEPGVLSMISLVGGGVWFIRRRFVI